VNIFENEEKIMIQTRLGDKIESEGFKIGDLVKLINPMFKYEINLILKITRIDEDDFVHCKNVKVKQSYYFLRKRDIKLI